MDKIIINIHSFIDVITNSSTEIFICDTDKILDEVRKLVFEIEKQYPNEYGHGLSVDYTDKYNYPCEYVDEEDAIKSLTAKGYTVIPPTKNSTPKYISISAERGGMDHRVENFIRKTFNVIDYNSEG